MRTKNNHKGKVGFIISSDWHLREDVPICRKDDFYHNQFKDLDFISDLQFKYNCPVLVPGDIFDHWKPSPKLLSDVIEHLPSQVYCIYGNHDLPQHNIDLANKCGLFTLDKADQIYVLGKSAVIFDDQLGYGCHWNEAVPVSLAHKSCVLLWHVEVYQGTNPYKNGQPSRAVQLLKDYPEYDLIVTGDNHMPFVESYEGRLLVNPGSLNIQSTSETHKPRVYLYYPESNTVEPVYIPQDHVQVSNDHLVVKKERDSRIDAFISGLNDDYNIGTSFEDNLQKFVEANEIGDAVNNIIIKSLE